MRTGRPSQAVAQGHGPAAHAVLQSSTDAVREQYRYKVYNYKEFKVANLSSRDEASHRFWNMRLLLSHEMRITFSSKY